MTVTDLIMHDLQCGNITVEKALKLIFREANRMLYVIPKKMKNKIIIEGEEFELPDDLVNDIKERFKKIKKLTYDGVMTYLYKDKPAYYITHDGDILKDGRFSKLSNNCTSEKQAKKLLAINKLMNVAKYLNGDWKCDANGKSTDCVYIFRLMDKTIAIESHVYIRSVFIFKTRELAQQAIDILGEDTIKLALSTDW